MDTVKVGKLVESLSATVAMSAGNNQATGEEIMYALAVVSVTAQALHADGVKNSSTAGIFDAIAMEMDDMAFALAKNPDVG